MRPVKSLHHRVSLPLVLTHVLLITMVTMSMIMSMPRLG
jgi:hypothetical protein